MKKILLFAILFSLFTGFNSCSNDDENDELRSDPSFNPVLGEWFGGGKKINEKYIFTVDFKCQKYERESQIKQWELVSVDGYLINSTHIKMGNNEPIAYYIRNKKELVLGVAGGDGYEYIYYKE